ncbi:hypothetical protein SESBI_45983 [Sesbania bispinosa]|nr:hypothetical protein SESBI_45983 [Sesbania bispinosa]
MGRDDNDGFADYNELLRTQVLAISACTTLVSVEPKLTVETRNHVMKVSEFPNKFDRPHWGSLQYKMIQLML